MNDSNPDNIPHLTWKKKCRDCVSKSNHMCVCLLLSFSFQPLDIFLSHVTHLWW